MLRINVVAYVTKKETAMSLKAAQNDITFSRSNMSVRQGDIDDAIEYYENDKDTPDLLIVEVEGEDRDAIYEKMDTLANYVTHGTKVMIIGYINDITFYRSLIDMGVDEYMSIPLTTADFVSCVRGIYGEAVINERGHTVAIAGARGGIGTSIIAQNIAASMAEIYKKPVTIIDLDIFFGTVGINLDVDISFGVRDALEIRNDKGELDESRMSKILVKKTENLWILGTNPSLLPCPELTFDNIAYVIDQVAKISEYIVLDIPHVWNDIFMEIMLSANHLLVGMDATLPALRNMQNINEVLVKKKPEGTKFDYFINLTGLDKTSELNLKEIQDAMKKEPISSIPWMPAEFRYAEMNGQLLIGEGGNKKVENKILDIAYKLKSPKDKTQYKKQENSLLESLKNIISR